jgi:hypothetical protein
MFSMTGMSGGGRLTHAPRAAQQSVHLTLGILRKSQAVFYALSFFQLDGFAVPAPAQVTPTVGRFIKNRNENSNDYFRV